MKIGKNFNRLKLNNRKILKGLLALSILLFFVSGVMLLIWQGNNASRTQLPAPQNLVVQKVDDRVILSFNPIANVSSYIVKINDIEQSVNPRNIPIDITALVSELGEYDISVKALGGNSYKSSDFSRPYVYTAYMVLQNPILENSAKDSLLAWFPIPYADYYKVVIDGFEPIIVEDCEFDYSHLGLIEGNVYDFKVIAYSDNDYIEDSSIQENPVSIKICLSGQLSKPQNLLFDGESKILSWGAVENARDYTVYINKNSWAEILEVNATNNSINLSEYLTDVGAYEFRVKADGYIVDDEETNYQFLASEKSSRLSYNYYVALQSPQNLMSTATVADIILNWDDVENADRYLIELLNEEDEVFYSDIVYTSAAQISRSITQNLFANLKVRVSALGFGFYLNSQPCDAIIVKVKDQMATPENLTVVENAGKKIFTFDQVKTNADGSVQISQHNGYVLFIQALDEYLQPVDSGATFDIVSNVFDITDVLLSPYYYSFTLQTKEYGSFVASEYSEPYIFKNKIQLTAVQNYGIELRDADTDNPKLVYYWEPLLPHKVPYYQLKIRTDIQGEYSITFRINYVSSQGQQLEPNATSPISSVGFYIVQQNGYYAQQSEDEDDPNRAWAELREDGKVYLCADLKYIYNEIYPDARSILEFGQVIYCSVLAFEIIDEEPIDFYASEWAPVVKYINYVKLNTPQIISVSQKSNTNISLRFSLVENATQYLVQVRGVQTSNTYRSMTIFSTTNIYNLLSPGDNIITVKAIGKNYYYDSDESEGVPFEYNVYLEAPNDVVIYYDEDSNKYYATFSNLEFAEFYKVRIKQRDNRNGDALNTYTILDEEYLANTDIIICDITDYILTYGYGEYILNVQANSTISNAVQSAWSSNARYCHNEKLSTPQNLSYNEETKMLSWDIVENATNGYNISIYSKYNETYYFEDSLSNSFDLNSVIQLNGFIGDFEIIISAKAIENKYFSQSDWSDAIEINVYDTLGEAHDFIYYAEDKTLIWSKDNRSDYDSLILSFQDNDCEEYEILMKQSNIPVLDLSDIFNEYGFGWYRIQVISKSTNELLFDSQSATYEVINYCKLVAPTLISIEGEKESQSLQVKFHTINQGMYYTILASADGEEYTEVLSDIPQTQKDSEDMISVDIYDALSKTFIGKPGVYYIAVRADAYDYFSQSDLSNSIDCELYLKHTAPTNLQIVEDGGIMMLSWDNDDSVEQWTVKLNNVSHIVEQNNYDLTDYIQNMSNGLLTILVMANGSDEGCGYWLDSDQSRYNYVKSSQLNTPILSYNKQNQEVIIVGDNSTDYVFYLVLEFDNDVTDEEITQKYEVNYLKILSFPMKYLFAEYGVGNYSITVKQLGDGVYWLDSETSETLSIDYISNLSSAQNISVKKEQHNDGEEVSYTYSLSFEKPMDSILAKIEIYEIADAQDYDITGLTAIQEFITKDSQNIPLNNLTPSKFYAIGVTLLGYVNYSSKVIYESNTSSQELNSIVKYLSFLDDSIIATQPFSTFGQQLQSPVITNVEVTNEENIDYLNITFEKVEDAETYSISIVRESNGGNIYQNASFDGSESFCSINDDEGTITIKVECGDYADAYDGYEITLKANQVLDVEEVKFLESLPKVFVFDNVNQFGKPNLSLVEIDDNLIVSTAEVTGAEYLFYITINGITEIHSGDNENKNRINLTSYLQGIGKYEVQVQLKGNDKWHLDSDLSDAIEYDYQIALGGVGEITLVASYDSIGSYVQLYAQWDAVENAVEYGILIKKGVNTVLETSTTATSFDLLSVVKNAGMGYYTIWVKTNDVDGYILGEQDYSSYVNFNYRVNLATPEIINIINEQTDTTISYIIEFTNVANAESYTLNFYDKDNSLIYSKILSQSVITLNASGNNTVVLDDYLADVLGGKYNLKLKADETDAYNASGESKAYPFELWKKYGEANLSAEQNTNAVLTVSFNNLGNGVLYSLYINGEIFAVNEEEIFAYPINNIAVGADALNVGETNTFTLVAHGNASTYTLDTIYTFTGNAFVFILDAPIITSITQDNNAVIGAPIIINFEQVMYASAYEICVDGVWQQNFIISNTGADISSLFNGLLPNKYTIRLKATNEDWGLTPNFSNFYDFEYELKFDLIQNLVVEVSADSTPTFVTTWEAPSNLQSYIALCESNGATLPALTFEIKLYYGEKTNERCIGTYDTNNLSYDLTNICSDPGKYIVSISVKENSLVKDLKTYKFNSSEYCDYEFEHYSKLPAPTNLSVNELNGVVRLTFINSQIPSYSHIEPEIYYCVEINGELLEYQYTTGTNGINITSFLQGGDNLIRVFAYSDNEYFTQSDYSADKIYTYSVPFDTITNFTIEEFYISMEKGYGQKFVFQKPNQKGLSEEDILALTYNLEYIYYGTTYDPTNEIIVGTGSYAKISAIEYSQVFMYIDVSNIVNNTIGYYKFKLQIREYSKDNVEILGRQLTIAYTQSSYSQMEEPYNYTKRADQIQLSDMVYKMYVDGQERDENEGLVMDGAYLYFAVNFDDTFISQQSSLSYEITLNNNVHNVEIPTSTLFDFEINNVSKRCAKINLLNLLGAEFDLTIPRKFSLRIRSLDQNGYRASVQSGTLDYIYKLKYDTPANLALVEENGKTYFTWTSDWSHDASSIQNSSFDLTITSLDILDPETDLPKYFNTVLSRLDFGAFEDNENQFILGNVFYFCIDGIAFAGDNKFEIYVKGDESLYYIDSDIKTINAEYSATIATPTITFTSREQDNESVDYANENIIHGANLEIYGSTNGDINYNSNATYEIKITAKVLKPVENSTQDVWIDFEMRLRTVRKGVDGVTISYFNGTDWVTYSDGTLYYYDGTNWISTTLQGLSGVYTLAQRKLSLTIPLDFPASYTAEVKALGNEELYTLDSASVESAPITLTYGTPAPTITAKFLLGNELRPEASRKAVDDIELVLGNARTQYYYGNTYEIGIYLDNNSGSGYAEIATIQVSANSYMLSNSDSQIDDVGLLEYIKTHNGKYKFTAQVLKLEKEIEGTYQTLYTESGKTETGEYTYISEGSYDGTVEIGDIETENTLNYYIYWAPYKGDNYSYKIFIDAIGNDEESFSIDVDMGEVELNEGLYQLELTDCMKDHPLIKYKVTVKAYNQENYQEIIYTNSDTLYNALKWSDPHLSIEQDDASLTLSYNDTNDTDYNLIYNLEVNGEIAIEGFIYSDNNGQIVFDARDSDKFAEYLNIGGQNTFTLIMLADSGECGIEKCGYRETKYSVDINEFVFKLNAPTIIEIKQTDIETIGAKIKLIFTTEDIYAISHTIALEYNSNIISTMDIDEKDIDSTREVDIASLFDGVLPGIYRVSIVSKNEDKNLTPSDPIEVDFEYILKFKSVEIKDINGNEDIENCEILKNDCNEVVLKWYKPTNFDAFNSLANNELEQKYKIKLSYLHSNYFEEVEIIISSEEEYPSYDLTQLCTEPGQYKVEIYTLDNDPFTGSDGCAEATYTYTYRLPSPSNIDLIDNGDNTATLSFVEIDLSEFELLSGLNLPIRYRIFINGCENPIIEDLENGNGIDLSDYLFGGENIIIVQAYDKSESGILLASDKVENKCEMHKKFNAPEIIDSGFIANGSKGYDFYIDLDADLIAGIYESDINASEDGIKYDIEFYEVKLGVSTYKCKDTFSPTIYHDEDGKSIIRITIDIQDKLGAELGQYSLLISRNDFTKTIEIGANSLALEYEGSASSSLEFKYENQISAISIYDAEIYDKDGKRDDGNGQKITDFILYWEITIDEQLWGEGKLSELYFYIKFNDKDDEHRVGIDTSNDIVKREIDGETYTCAKYNLMDLLESNIGLSIPSDIKIFVRAEGFGNYASAEYDKYYQYTYHLNYDPVNIKVIDNVQEKIENCDGRYYLAIEWPSDPDSLSASQKAMTKGKLFILSEYDNSDKEIDFTKITTNPSYFDAENKEYYLLCIDDYIFAGTNNITITADANDDLGYLETILLSTEEDFQVKLKDIEIEISEYSLDSENNGIVTNVKGIIITITNNNADHYNKDFTFEITITDCHNVSKKYNISSNDSECDTNESKNTITKRFELDPGTYTVGAKALGKKDKGILDSNTVTADPITLTYNSPNPDISVVFTKGDYGLLSDVLVILESDLTKKCDVNFVLVISKGSDIVDTIKIGVEKNLSGGKTSLEIHFKENKYLLNYADGNLETIVNSELSNILDKIRLMPGVKFTCYTEAVGCSCGQHTLYNESAHITSDSEYSLQWGKIKDNIEIVYLQKLNGQYEYVTELSEEDNVEYCVGYLKWQATGLLKTYMDNERKDITFALSVKPTNNEYYQNKYSGLGGLEVTSISQVEGYEIFKNLSVISNNADCKFFYCKSDGYFYYAIDTSRHLEMYPEKNDITISINEYKGVKESDKTVKEELEYIKKLSAPKIANNGINNITDDNKEGFTIGISIELENKIPFSLNNKIGITLELNDNIEEVGYAELNDNSGTILIYKFKKDLASGYYTIKIKSVGDYKNENGYLWDSHEIVIDNHKLEQKLKTPEIKIYNYDKGSESYSENTDEIKTLTLIYQSESTFIPEKELALGIDCKSIPKDSTIIINLYENYDPSQTDKSPSHTVEYTLEDKVDIYYVKLYDIVGKDNTKIFSQIGNWGISVQIEKSDLNDPSNSYTPSNETNKELVIVNYRLLNPELKEDNGTIKFEFENQEQNDNIAEMVNAKYGYKLYYQKSENGAEVKEFNIDRILYQADNAYYNGIYLNSIIIPYEYYFRNLLNQASVKAGTYRIYFKAVPTSGNTGYLLASGENDSIGYSTNYLEIVYKYSLGNLSIEQATYNNSEYVCDEDFMNDVNDAEKGYTSYPQRMAFQYYFGISLDNYYVPLKLTYTNGGNTSTTTICLNVQKMGNFDYKNGKISKDSTEIIGIFDALKKILPKYNNDENAVEKGTYKIEYSIDESDDYYGISGTFPVYIYHKLNTPSFVDGSIKLEYSAGKNEIELDLKDVQTIKDEYNKDVDLELEFSLAFNSTSKKYITVNSSTVENGEMTLTFSESEYKNQFIGRCTIEVHLSAKDQDRDKYFLFRSNTITDNSIYVVIAPQIEAQLSVENNSGNENSDGIYNKLQLTIKSITLNGGTPITKTEDISAYNGDNALTYILEIRENKDYDKDEEPIYSSNKDNPYTLNQINFELGYKYGLLKKYVIHPGEYRIILLCQYKDENGNSSGWATCSRPEKDADDKMQYYDGSEKSVVTLTYTVRYFGYESYNECLDEESGEIYYEGVGTKHDFRPEISTHYEYGNYGKGCVSSISIKQGRIHDAYGNIEPINYIMYFKERGMYRIEKSDDKRELYFQLFNTSEADIRRQQGTTASAFYGEYYNFKNDNDTTTGRITCSLQISLQSGYEAYAPYVYLIDDKCPAYGKKKEIHRDDELEEEIEIELEEYEFKSNSYTDFDLFTARQRLKKVDEKDITGSAWIEGRILQTDLIHIEVKWKVEPQPVSHHMYGEFYAFNGNGIPDAVYGTVRIANPLITIAAGSILGSNAYAEWKREGDFYDSFSGESEVGWLSAGDGNANFSVILQLKSDSYEYADSAKTIYPILT